MLHDLFSEKITLDEDGKSWLLHSPEFISKQSSELLMERLLAQTPWQQDDIRIAGKVMPIPRLQAWYGDMKTQYGYSGIVLTPIPFTRNLSRLKAKIEEHAGTTFNSMLANLYRNGNDSVSWHADDEPELGTNPIIASLSLGATRRFSLKHKHDRSVPTQRIDLHHGDLLIMGGETQHHWLHQVAKTKTVDQPRINLTFRKIHVK